MSLCRVTVTPEDHGRGIELTHVRVEAEGLCRKASQPLFRAQVETVSVHGAEPRDVRAEDDLGPLPLSVRETEEYPIVYRLWEGQRDISGRLVIEYTVSPCERLNHGRHGPYFQFAREAGGVSGPGIAFLIDLPGLEGTASLRWDLSRLPAGSRAVCAWGEGDVEREDGLENLRQIYYAVGPVQSITEGEFGFYWLTEPSFDVRSLADYTRHLFGVMQDFFRDDQPVYRIFMRHDLTESSGGTALTRCYMFGWNDRQPVSVLDKQNLLAHEMVHNWPHLNDVPYGETTWYEEGTAEYYSILIPLRAGLISKEQALQEIQKRTDAYYTNPTRHLSDQEAAKVCWQDRRAQRLAYGRGIFFLANTDARIRRATKGKKSLDDVVLALLDLGRSGAELGNEAFLRAVSELSSIDVSEDWRAMHEGAHFAPDPDSFDSLFTVAEVPALEADTGKAAVSYRWALR